MKKKIVCLFSTIGSLFCLVGCDGDKYLSFEDKMANTYKTSDIFDDYVLNGGLVVYSNVGDTKTQLEKNSFTYTVVSENKVQKDTSYKFGEPGEYTVTISFEAYKDISYTINVQPIPVEEIRLNETSLNLKEGNSKTLFATVLPSDATYKTVTWSSTNENIATVSNGIVNALSTGETDIIASSFDSQIKATCHLTVSPKTVYPTSISLNETSIKMFINDEFDLVASLLPENTTNKEIIWTSSNDNASVSNGKVKALKEGKCVITAKPAANSNLKVTCIVTILGYRVSNIVLSDTNIELGIGRTIQLAATIEPSNAYNKTVLWSSSDSTIATVSNSGLVKANENGKTVKVIITVTSEEELVKTTCEINVVLSPKDRWTILLYICGADLESQHGVASSNISDILSVKNQPDNINIAIEAGGTKKWYTNNFNTNKLNRAYVRNNKLNITEYLDNKSMGKESTFEDFLTWGLTAYPAEKVGVIVWDHGGAMCGCCYDENYNDESLTNDEIQLACKNAFKKTGNTKLEFIGYDCCLMQVQDIAEFNSEYFNYMIGCEEAEYGFDYKGWVDNLYRNEPTESILKEMCDTYISWCNRNYVYKQTISYLDLNKMPAYFDAFETFADKLYYKLKSKSYYDYSNFSSWVKNNVKVFGNIDGQDNSQYYSLYDAYDFVDKLSKVSDFNPGDVYINNFKSAFNNLVKYNVIQSSADKSYGLGLIFKASNYYSLNDYYNENTTNFSKWLTFCYKYSYL